MNTEVNLRGLRPGDAGWILQRHGEVYAEEHGFDARFEAVVARIVADFLDGNAPETESGWNAETAAGARLGCVLCTRESPEMARLRILLVEPEARGMGVGRRLVSACLQFARSQGYAGVTLWTQKGLKAACALYAAQGFACVAEEPGEEFGQSVVNQTWEIRF